jgi:serine phosphatase RsbU (regulator of sigma subunit)
MPLGLMPSMSYEEKEIALDVGEGVFFYSDGLVEAHDPKGEMFGFPRLRALIAEHGEESSLGNLLLARIIHERLRRTWKERAIGFALGDLRQDVDGSWSVAP